MTIQANDSESDLQGQRQADLLTRVEALRALANRLERVANGNGVIGLIVATNAESDACDPDSDSPAHPMLTMNKVREEPGWSPGSDSRLAALSPQQLAVVSCVAQGMSNKQVAAELHISPRTVASHLYRLFPQLGVATRAELAARFPHSS